MDATLTRTQWFDGSTPFKAACVEQLVRVESHSSDNAFVLCTDFFELAERRVNLSLLRGRQRKRSFQCRDLSTRIPFDKTHGNQHCCSDQDDSAQPELRFVVLLWCW